MSMPNAQPLACKYHPPLKGIGTPFSGEMMVPSLGQGTYKLNPEVACGGKQACAPRMMETC